MQLETIVKSGGDNPIEKFSRMRLSLFIDLQGKSLLQIKGGGVLLVLISL